MTDRAFPFVLALLSFATVAMGQESVPGAVRGARVADDAAAAARTTFACVNTHGPEVLAVGRGYRAAFDERAVTYRPALGKAAPRAYPFRIELQRVERGEFAFDASAAPCERSVDERARTVAFARPNGIVERYVAMPDGLAQSVTFAGPIGGKGDLVVTFAVATDLEAAGADPQSLAWLAPSLGGVTISTVAGIDSNGRRVDGSMARTDRGYELRLPAAFVDSAVYPLVLDPLIGPVVDALPGYDIDFPDVAYEPFSDSYCLGWTMYGGGGTSDAVGALFRASDRSLAAAFVINQSGDEDGVRVTSIAGMGVYVFVWLNLPPGGTALQIATMTLEPTQPAASQVYVIAGPGGVSSPRLSGEATIYDDDCLVIWDDDQQGVVGASLQVNPDLTMGMTAPIVIGGGVDATEIAISKQGGDAGLHVVTWVDRPAGMPGWIRARVVDHDMVLQGPPAWIQNVPQDAGYPALDGDGFLFFVAWEQQELANPSAVDVLGRTITVSPAGITSMSQVFDVAVYPGDLDGAVDVATLGEAFGVVYQSGLASSSFVDDVYYRTFARNGQPIGPENRLELNTSSFYAYEHAPRIVSRRDGDATSSSDAGLVVFADQHNRSAESDIGLSAVEAIGAGGPVVDRGGGCGPSGLCAARGPCALGNSTFAIELHGAQTLAVPFLIVGFSHRPLLPCGVCTVVDPHLFQFWPNTAGTATATLPLPGDPVFAGLALELQWASLNVAYVGCPLAPGVAVSNRVQATIGF